MKLPRIKVCGLARVEDVHTALAAGAEAVGAVHYAPSPRSVEVTEMVQLFAEVPPEVLTVGVVVDLAADQVGPFLAASGVRALQLCGPQTPEAWAGAPVPLLRRIPVDARGADELRAWQGVAAGFVLDHPKTAGGSGQTVDFALAAKLATQAPCLLAGGLSAGNTSEAIDAVRPHGVDASSRLEQMPGRKNPAAVYAFVQAAHAALCGPDGSSPATTD